MGGPGLVRFGPPADRVVHGLPSELARTGPDLAQPREQVSRIGPSAGNEHSASLTSFLISGNRSADVEHALHLVL